jgi:hypothetical protein
MDLVQIITGGEGGINSYAKHFNNRKTKQTTKSCGFQYASKLYQLSSCHWSTKLMPVLISTSASKSSKAGNFSLPSTSHHFLRLNLSI